MSREIIKFTFSLLSAADPGRARVCALMAVVIEREEWEIPSSAYYLLFASCFASLFFFPFFSSRSFPFSLHSFEHAQASSFLRFQKGFLFVYSLASGTLFYMCVGVGVVQVLYQLIPVDKGVLCAI